MLNTETHSGNFDFGEIELQMDGFDGTQHEVSCSGGRFTHSRREPAMENPSWQLTVFPTAERWANFWVEIQKMGVWDWKPADWTAVLDGGARGLSLRRGPRHLESKGFSESGTRSYTRQTAFGQILAALEKLAGAGTLFYEDHSQN